MTEFDPEKFEEKYVYYFEELEEAYSNAYNQLHGRYDSSVLRAIDRKVLSESEPFYEGSAERSSADSEAAEPREHDGEFRVELPNDPYDRLTGVVVEKDRFEQVLEKHVEEIETELERVFGF